MKIFIDDDDDDDDDDALPLMFAVPGKAQELRAHTHISALTDLQNWMEVPVLPFAGIGSERR